MSFEAFSKPTRKYMFQTLRRETDDEHGKLIKKPWRHLERRGSWDETYKNTLLEDIRYNRINYRNVENIRILLLGPINAGKSSFINTIASIDRGRIAQVVAAGFGETSMSTKLKQFLPHGRLNNFQLLDTMGIEDAEQSRFNIEDFHYIIKGHVKPNCRLDFFRPFDKECREFNNYPNKGDQIHCAVFVIDAVLVGQDKISDETKKKIKFLGDMVIYQDLYNSQRSGAVKDVNPMLIDLSLDIPRIVLLTKIDVLCELIETDIANCYRSAAMENAVNLAEELFSVPKQNIFPVQNYSNEMEIDPKKDILSLLALRQMIYFATDFLDENATSDDEDYCERGLRWDMS